MIYSCIDIGSDTIKIVVGKIENNEIYILSATNTRSVGIKKGIIVDKDLAMKSINLALDEVEKELGFRIDKAIINVPLNNVNVDIYNGLCYPDGEITGDDVITCFKSSVSTIDMDKEVVTVFPIDFLIDDEKTVFANNAIPYFRLHRINETYIRFIYTKNSYEISIKKQGDICTIDITQNNQPFKTFKCLGDLFYYNKHYLFSVDDSNFYIKKNVSKSYILAQDVDKKTILKIIGYYHEETDILLFAYEYDPHAIKYFTIEGVSPLYEIKTDIKHYK